jgi:uncharacterized protein GlcG (DUF336 family)
MKKHETATVARLVSAALLAACSLWAQAAHAEAATWKQTVITPETALKAAQAAKAECAKRGWQVAVAVTDPSGLPLVLLRKARTAASWREATTTVAARVNKPGAAEAAIKDLPGVVMIGGGLPIEAAGQMVGAIGVSGAPGGDNDDVCAKAGIAAVEADLAF